MKTIFNSHILFLWKGVTQIRNARLSRPLGECWLQRHPAWHHPVCQDGQVGRSWDLGLLDLLEGKNPSTSSSFDGSLSFSESCHVDAFWRWKTPCKRITILQLKALVYPHISGRQVSCLTDFQLPIGFEGRTNMASCEIHTETYMDNPKGSCICIYIYFIFYILN